MANEDDYESLPPHAGLTSHMLAGACAGIMEHAIMYPIDCVKTRMQCLKPTCDVRYGGVVDGLRQMIRDEGLRRTVRGIGAVVGGAGPAHALFFASYEFGKENLKPIVGNDQLAYAMSGVCATAFHDMIMTPADAVKQRVQMYNSPFKSSWQCFSSVIRSQGVHVLYRAYITQCMMNIPFQVTHFIAYETGQDLLNKDRQYHPLSHMISGGCAGAFAAAVTNPLDVCKTVLNTQDQCALTVAPGEQRIRGIFGAARTIFMTEGLSGFSRGLKARIIFQMPSAAISWSVYELFKALLKGSDLRPKSAGSDDQSEFPVFATASSNGVEDHKD